MEEEISRKKCECCGRWKRLEDQISEHHSTCLACWNTWKKMDRILARQAGEARRGRLRFVTSKEFLEALDDPDAEAPS